MRVFLSFLGALILIGTLLIGIYGIHTNVTWGKRPRRKRTDGESK